MLPFMPTVPVGPPPISADYTDPNAKDKSQQMANTKLQQGSNASINPGVILTADGLDVPLEVMFNLTNQRSESSRPTLMPIFRSRYVEDGQTVGIDSTNDYQALRDSLSPALRGMLEKDETLGFEERDPNLIALDHALHFAAMSLAMSRQFGLPPAEMEKALLAAEKFLDQPSTAQQNLVEYTTVLTSYLNQYLQEVGPNEPGYDLWLNALNQIVSLEDQLRGG